MIATSRSVECLEFVNKESMRILLKTIALVFSQTFTSYTSDIKELLVIQMMQKEAACRTLMIQLIIFSFSEKKNTFSVVNSTESRHGLVKAVQHLITNLPKQSFLIIYALSSPACRRQKENVKKVLYNHKMQPYCQVPIYII